MMTLFGAIFGKPILHEWHKLFIWRTAVDGVPTKANFDRFFKIGDDICPLCKLEVESSIHLFALCPVAKSVWFNSYGFNSLRMDSLGFSSAVDLIQFLFSPPFANASSQRTSS